MAVSSPAVLQTKIEKLELNMARFDSIINADNTTDVAVDVGTTPSVRKLWDSISIGVDWVDGGWVTATAYVRNDTLSWNGVVYRCTTNHTSGSTTQPGIGASWTTRWEVIPLSHYLPNLSSGRQARQALKMAAKRWLFIMDSQGNNSFATNNSDPATHMSYNAQGEPFVLASILPGIDVDTWHNAAFNATTWVAGSNQSRSSGQVGGGAYASTTLSSTGPANNDTITVNGQAYTFKTTLTGAAYEVQIGATLRLTVRNLVDAVNAKAGVAGVNYGESTVAHSTVGAEQDGLTAYFIAIASGTGGNAYTLAKSGANIAISGATFSGGIANTQLDMENWFSSVEITNYDGVIINGGINNLWLNTPVRPNAVTIWSLRRIINRALKCAGPVVVGTPRPVGTTVGVDSTTWALGSAKRTALIDLRNRIQALIQSEYVSQSVEFWDPWLDLGTAGDAALDKLITDYGYDPGLHLSTLGTYPSAVGLRDRHIKRHVPAVPAMPEWRFQNKLPGYEFDTQVATATLRVTGNVPTGFTAAWESGSDVNMYATLTYTDYPSEDYQDLNIHLAPSGAGNESGFIIQQYGIAIPPDSVGLWFRAGAVIDMSVWDAWIGANVGYDHRDADDAVSFHTSRPRINGTTQAGTPDAWPQVAMTDRVLLGPPFQLPASRTSLSWYFTVWARGDLGGSGDIGLKRRFFSVCEDPTKYWGMP